MSEPQVSVPSWSEVKNLAWWCAKKYCRIFKNYSPQDFIGELYLTYLKCAEPGAFDGQHKFSTYFIKASFRAISKARMQDSELGHKLSQPRTQEGDEAFAAYEISGKPFKRNGVVFYRVAPQDDMVQSVINFFDTRAELWDWLCRGLDQRSRHILEMRYMAGMTLNECGESWDLTIERIRQLEKRALSRITERLATIKDFADLFTPPTQPREDA